MGATYFRTDTPSEAIAVLAARGADDLAAGIVNDALNGLIRQHSESLFGHMAGDEDRGQPVPFAGWYWRDVDFFGKYGVTIADTEDGTRVCENNKWGYPERNLSPDEQDRFLALIWDAWLESRNGGNLAEIQKATQAALERAGEYISGLGDFPAQEW